MFAHASHRWSCEKVNRVSRCCNPLIFRFPLALCTISGWPGKRVTLMDLADALVSEAGGRAPDRKLP